MPGSRSEERAEAGGRHLPGRADGFPPGPPTDPDVRHARLRFLTQSCCCPCTVHRPAVVRVSARKVSPLCPAGGCAARRRLPSRGSLGPHFPTFPGTLRRDDCPPGPLGVLRVSRVPRYRAYFRCSWCPVWARRLVAAPGRRQGLWSPGPLFRAWRLETGGSPTFPRSPSEDLPRSQTPVVSSVRAIPHPGLLPSSVCTPSAFPSIHP